MLLRVRRDKGRKRILSNDRHRRRRADPLAKRERPKDLTERVGGAERPLRIGRLDKRRRSLRELDQADRVDRHLLLLHLVHLGSLLVERGRGVGSRSRGEGELDRGFDELGEGEDGGEVVEPLEDDGEARGLSVVTRGAGADRTESFAGQSVLLEAVRGGVEGDGEGSSEEGRNAVPPFVSLWSRAGRKEERTEPS